MEKLIWITGASSGIGRATALEAGARGYKLALTARRVDKLESLKQELISIGVIESKIQIAVADVTKLEQVSAAYNLITADLGKVDILFANAGSHTPTSSKSFDVVKYKDLFDLNFFGVLNCIEIVLPQMQENKSGHIVGVSSVAGYSALPTAAIYGASKAALSYFLDSLRFDLEKQAINVTVVSPGFVKTELTAKNDFPMPCLIEANEAAKIIMDGIANKDYEIHFPKRFTLMLKFLRLLPQRLYHRLIYKLVIR